MSIIGIIVMPIFVVCTILFCVNVLLQLFGVYMFRDAVADYEDYKGRRDYPEAYSLSKISHALIPHLLPKSKELK